MTKNPVVCTTGFYDVTKVSYVHPNYMVMNNARHSKINKDF